MFDKRVEPSQENCARCGEPGGIAWLGWRRFHIGCLCLHAEELEKDNARFRKAISDQLPEIMFGDEQASADALRELLQDSEP